MPKAEKSPLRAFFDIRREELPDAIMMFSYFLLVITTFWVLKPLKKSLFISHYDVTGLDLVALHLSAAQTELLAKVLNLVVAYFATTAFSALSSRYHRQQLTHIFSTGFIGAFLLFAWLLLEPGSVSVWTFYLLGDLYSTLMVATFFVFLNDIATPDSAKRTYGVIGLGGVVGGMLGSMALASLIQRVPLWAWLLGCCLIMVAIMVIAAAVGRRHPRRDDARASASTASKANEAGGNPAFDGARLVLRSRYLLAIVGIVAIYEMVSTILDFQFSATLSHYLDGNAIRDHLTLVFAIMNGTAFVVQLLMTSYVMKHWGLRTALLVLPATTLLASVGFLALPILWMGSLIPTLDGAFSYSVNQSAKESLYIPTTREERYKAKAFIDMFVQRFAKALAVVLSLGLTLLVADFAGVRWLSLVTLVLIGIWSVLARYAGTHFDDLALEAEATAETGSPDER
ncbi:MAG: MFS transporter [Myxococcales bacterium]|nr:MFS transporter [Myxococcales bacterium]